MVQASAPTEAQAQRSILFVDKRSSLSALSLASVGVFLPSAA